VFSSAPARTWRNCRSCAISIRESSSGERAQASAVAAFWALRDAMPESPRNLEWSAAPRYFVCRRARLENLSRRRDDMPGKIATLRTLIAQLSAQNARFGSLILEKAIRIINEVDIMPLPIAALDIGTTKTCALIGEMTDAGTVRILGSGIARRAVCGKASLRDVKEAAARDCQRGRTSELVPDCAGFGVRRIAGAHIQSTNSRGVAGDSFRGAASRKTILTAPRSGGSHRCSRRNREIIHSFRRVTLDGQDGVKRPA